jgi:hypothetical protein
MKLSCAAEVEEFPLKRLDEVDELEKELVKEPLE